MLVYCWSTAGLLLVYCWSAGRRELYAQRSYAFINSRHDTLDVRRRYGLGMEEHGRRSLINADIQPRDYYHLVGDIGAGSSRVFSLAAPHYVSKGR